MKPTVIDISKHLSIRENGTSVIQPFITWHVGAEFGKDLRKICWLEYCPLSEPGRGELNARPTPNPMQQPGSYSSLPMMTVRLDGKEHLIYDCVCERIEDGRIGLVQLASGSLWTMIPK